MKKIASVYSLIFFTCITVATILHFSNQKVSANTTVLKGGQKIDVVSYQAHLICPNAKLLQLIKQTIDEQKSNWDIVGFQEFRNGVGKTKPPCYAQQRFIEEAKIVGLEYNCVHQQTPNIDDLHLSICSRFPLRTETYKEAIIHFAAERPRIVQCVEVLVPENPIIFCNIHTRISKGQELPVHQLLRATPFIINEFIPSLIPSSITNAQGRELYRMANLGRSILVGDFNQSDKPTYPFVSTCRYKGADAANCWKGSSGIDHITTINMLDTSVISNAQLQKEFLVPEFFYRHNELEWPTDHVGPVFSRIHIQPLSIHMESQNISASDINADGIVNIFDYNMLLQSFGKTGAIDFDPADIIQNGVIDIYDFNELLQNFVK